MRTSIIIAICLVFALAYVVAQEKCDDGRQCRGQQQCCCHTNSTDNNKTCTCCGKNAVCCNTTKHHHAWCCKQNQKCGEKRGQCVASAPAAPKCDDGRQCRGEKDSCCCNNETPKNCTCCREGNSCCILEAHHWCCRPNMKCGAKHHQCVPS